jgi:two-component system, OmpR family, response regulator TctD
MRLLIVEDNVDLAEWLAKLLRGENYVVDCLYDGEAAIDGANPENYDLVIVDLALPKIGGIEVIRDLRARGLSTPILILTAKDALQSRVEGLNAGADDYLIKPFEIEELEARLRALLRRSGTTLKSELRFGPLSFDQNTRLFAIEGVEMQLSPREHAVLEALLRRAGATVSKQMLLESTYGFDDEANLSAIEVHVHRLRKKLANSAVSIATLRGLGYLLRLEQP